MSSSSVRSCFIDCLKGISILSVVFYHAGYFPHGYLGVDVFFAIAGFLTTVSIVRNVESGAFSYWSFLWRRALRICPLVFVISLLSLLVGFVVMLPDDLENLAASVVATDVFANNVLQCITTKNYWDVVNDYKPLLHTWYLGVLAQFYLIYPVVLVLLLRLARGRRRIVILGLGVLTIISFAGYVFVNTMPAQRFYYLHFRFFEFGIGALLALLGVKSRIFLRRMKLDWLFENRLLAGMGAASYSIYLCHQPILAYMRYALTAPRLILPLLTYLLLTALVSWLAFILFERHDGLFVRNNHTALLCGLVASAGGVLLGLFIYARAGVMHDVPELEISADHVERGIHGRYNSRMYAFRKPFEENGKINVLCYGNSFARDWGNVLLESSISNRINLSYVTMDSHPNDLAERVKRADYIFAGTAGEIVEVPAWLGQESLQKFYILGNKRFGESNGVIYNRRWFAGYYEQTYRLPKWLQECNARQRKLVGDHYVDLLGMAEVEKGVVRVFTEDRRFISQDCRHLTRAGAKYFARKLEETRPRIWERLTEALK